MNHGFDGAGRSAASTKNSTAIGSDYDLNAGIIGHSFRFGSAQDLLVSDVSILTHMQWGEWSKSDTAMPYLEQFGSVK